MQARADVEKNADALLSSGMESKNQNQMALALQVTETQDLQSLHI
jgi:hypothetical protein